MYSIFSKKKVFTFNRISLEHGGIIGLNPLLLAVMHSFSCAPIATLRNMFLEIIHNPLKIPENATDKGQG